MPKLEIDYSNTIIYKITCIEPNITDVYVGHTTNFVQRKHAHKQSCTNQKSANYKCKLYDVIRNNGGWKNWKMEIINFYNCHDHYEARKKEQEYFISLNATLNSIEPLPKPKPKPKPNPEPKKTFNHVIENKVFYCDKCNINCHSLKLLEIHNESKKHNKPATANPNLPKTPKIICETCDFITNNKKDYMRHTMTVKHQIANGLLIENPKKKQNKCDIYTCECGKQYKHGSSLCKHRNTCNIIKQEILTPLVTDASNNIISGELVLELLKQNNEFRELIKDQNKQMMEQNKYFIENQNKQIMEQNKYLIDNQNKQMMDQNNQMMEQNKYFIENQNKQMMELVSKGIGNTTNMNCNNTTKNKFNLNIFLNEQCKDAMNIMDFVNSLQFKLTDLERVGELGYVKGISHIILNKLKALDICKRPIHCSDLKRETMYVKDENAWEKENGKNEKITKMIKHVAHKNQLQINEWRQENPEHKNPESVKCDKFLAIVNQSMGGSTEDDDINNYNKIIKNIAKEVIIDRAPE